jgi:hypothetical protein
MSKPCICHMVLLCSLLLAGVSHAAPTTVQQCRQAGVTEYSDRPGRCTEPRQVVVDPAATHGLDGGAPISSPERRAAAIHKNTRTERPVESARSGLVRRPTRIDQARRCRDLEHQLHQIDEQAARPSSGSRQDRLRIRRMRVRSLQTQQGC